MSFYLGTSIVGHGDIHCLCHISQSPSIRGGLKDSFSFYNLYCGIFGKSYLKHGLKHNGRGGWRFVEMQAMGKEKRRRHEIGVT